VSRFVVYYESDGSARIRKLILDASLRGHIGPILLTNGVYEDGQYLAELIENGEVSKVGIGKFLAQHGVDELQLLAIRTNSLGVVSSSYAASAEVQLASWLRSELSKAGSQFTTGVLVALKPEDSISTEMFIPQWDYNLLLSPQEGAGQQGFVNSELTGIENEELAFVVAGLVTGAWVWVEEPVSSIVKLKTIVSENLTRVVRSTVRVVDAGDLAVRLTAEALELSNSWPTPENTDVHPDPERFIDEVSEAIVSHETVHFCVSPHPDLQTDSKRPAGLLESVVLFFKQLGDELLRMPGRWIQKIKDRATNAIEDIINNKLFDQDSKVLARFGGKMRAEDFQYSTSMLSGAALGLPNLAPISPTPTPTTWRNLTGAVLGVIDGASIDDVSSGRASSTSDPRRVLRDREFVAARVTLESDGLEIPLAELGLESGAEKGQRDSVTVRSYDALTFKRVNAFLDHSEKTDNAAKSELSTIRQKLGQFESERSKTLLWKLADTLSGAVIESEEKWIAVIDEYSNLSEEIKTDIAESAALQKRASKRIRRIIILLSVMLLATITGFIFVTALVGLIVLGLLVASFFGSIVSFLKIAREQVRLRNKLANPQSRVSHLLEKRQHYYQESVRLGALYDQYLDWADVLGTIVLSPYGKSERRLEAEPYVPESKLASFVVGTPEQNNETAQGEKQRLRRQIVKRQWMSTLLLGLVELWKEDYARIGGYSVANIPTPGMDVMSSSDQRDDEGAEDYLLSPRRDFSTRVLQGKYARRLRTEVENHMRDLFKDSDPSRVLGNIQSIIPGLSGGSTAEFVQPLLVMTPLPDFQDSILFDVAGGTIGVDVSVHGVSNQYSVEVPDDGVRREMIGVRTLDNRFVMASFRMDFSENVPVARLKRLTQRESQGTGLKVVGPVDEGDF